MSKQVKQIKERLNHLANEVYAEDLFPPVDYKELKETLGSKLLSRVSADNFRYSAKSILDWIESEIDTEDKPITPEFLEFLGFDNETYGFIAKYSLRIRLDTFLLVNVKFNPQHDSTEVEIMGEMLNNIELPHIRTQSQLTNLITALFGEVNNE